MNRVNWWRCLWNREIPRTQARKNLYKILVGGMAKAGLICGIVGASLAVVVLLASFMIGSMGMFSMFSYFL